MNRSTGLIVTLKSRASPFFINPSYFHVSPILERRRRTHWNYGSNFKSSPKKFNEYYKRLRKQTLLRDVGDFAEQLFQSWKSDCDEYNHPLGQKPSWFRPGFEEDAHRRERSRNKTSSNFRRKFEFCMEDDEDDDFRTIFRSAFSGNPYMYWSFTIDGENRFRNSSNSYGNYSRFNDYEDDNSSDEYEKCSRDMRSDRRALGLKSSGPINLEDVKNAYRSCALKWHPDRHQGSSKAVAEEKFKACSAAYQSLCEEMTLN